jgi:hypothetical protein
MYGLYRIGLYRIGLYRIGLYRIGLYRIGLYRTGRPDWTYRDGGIVGAVEVRCRR